jgi:GxxExxY protein
MDRFILEAAEKRNSSYVVDAETERIGKEVVDSAITVHRELGPGLLESAYEACLAFELVSRGFHVVQQQECPIHYRGHLVKCAFKLDLVINDSVIVEVKAVEKIHPVHKAQLISYLKLTDISLGFLINFHERLVKNGLERFVN